MFIKKSLNLSSILSRKILTIAMIMMTSSLSLNAHDQKFQYKDTSSKNSKFDGFYFGLTGGKNFGKNRININGRTNYRFNVSTDLNSSSGSISGGVVLGYGKVTKDIYGGIEVIGELSSHKSKNTFTNQNMAKVSFNSQLKQKNNIIVAANIGKQVDEKTLIYGKAGVSSSRYTLSADIINEMALSKRTANFSKNLRIVQPVLGIGVERKIANLTPNIPVYTSAEYRKTIRKTRRIDISSDSFVGKGKVKPSADSISLRVLLRL